jgi:EAL domain-containing protein (putative c-di-GMP-specific phosphodiesterase class I)/GGDEF domain-containing protein
MDSVDGYTGSALARVIVARREQIRARIVICVAAAAFFQMLTGTVPALIWAAVYISFQAGEYILLNHVTEMTPVTRWSKIGFFAVMVSSNTLFASFGIVECYYAGPWGVICACLIWTGAILNGAMVSGESRGALAASIAPPFLHFAAVPYFVISEGGGVIVAIAVVMAGLLNGVSSIAIWSSGRKLLETAARAGETARLALLDPETGLANWQALQSRLIAMQDRNSAGIIVVAAIGLDRFIHLRGAIGHALMLKLIGELAARFSRVYGNVQIARLSSGYLGMAFVALDMESAMRVATRLREAAKTPVPLGDNRVDVNVTVGLSHPDDALGPSNDVTVIERAMIAVDQARAARVPVACFDPVRYGSPGANLSLMSEMLRALENGQISVHYQPKYDLRKGAVIGIEALVRWQHPQRGAIGPDLFVQMAEETGHILAMTEWVLRRAVADQHILKAAGHDLAVAINWSGLVINDAALTDLALELTATAADPICLEVTETAIIGNPEFARLTLERFRAAGLHIAIDDYGSGLSSLAYLKNIPADELKIDKAFVMNMANDPADAVLVRSAVSLAHSLGLRSVAEGVENQATLDLLYAMGCDLVQGFLIARPMPLEALLTYLGEREPLAETA